MLHIARLKQLVLMLSSPHDGEVIAAAKAISRTLASDGRDFHWLADRLDGQDSIPMPALRPPHDTTGMTVAEVARWSLDHGVGRLSRKERDFLFNLSRRAGPPTPKQHRWLTDIHERLSQRT